METLCFHAQQTVEKSIKAVLIHFRIAFPYTHDIAVLRDLVRSSGRNWPNDLDRAAELTDYAVESRYPGPFDEVTREEYDQAVALATRVLAWAEQSIVGDETRQ